MRIGSERMESKPSPLAVPSGLGRALRSMLSRLAEWRERHEQRKTLAAMNERMLKDVGISRSDAIRESSKPFWQA